MATLKPVLLVSLCPVLTCLLFLTEEIILLWTPQPLIYVKTDFTDEGDERQRSSGPHFRAADCLDYCREALPTFPSVCQEEKKVAAAETTSQTTSETQRGLGPEAWVGGWEWWGTPVIYIIYTSKDRADGSY